MDKGTPVNLTSTNDVTTADCALIGFYVNNTTGGTLIITKGGSGGTAISGTITPDKGWNKFPASCPGGVHATIANTLDVTFFVVEGQT